MFEGISSFASLLQQAQQMGSKIRQVQQQLKHRRATGSAGGGMVTAEVNGLGELLRVSIEPQLVEQGEREVIEDLIPAAVNQALEKAKQLHTEAMQSIASDLDVPGLREALARLTGTQ